MPAWRPFAASNPLHWYLPESSANMDWGVSLLLLLLSNSISFPLGMQAKLAHW